MFVWVLVDLFAPLFDFLRLVGFIVCLFYFVVCYFWVWMLYSPVGGFVFN